MEDDEDEGPELILGGTLLFRLVASTQLELDTANNLTWHSSTSMSIFRSFCGWAGNRGLIGTTRSHGLILGLHCQFEFPSLISCNHNT